MPGMMLKTRFYLPMHVSTIYHIRIKKWTIVSSLE